MNERIHPAHKLITGAIDLHIHTAPDIYPRSVTTFEAAMEAREAGMAAMVVKSHSTDTAARAELVRGLTGFAVWGGVALNYSVGGLNPYAVIETVRQGGRVVWMPTTSARNFLQKADSVPVLKEKAPITAPGLVVSSDGRLSPDVLTIIDLISSNDLVLASGHLASEETILLFEEARSRGVKRLVVTHPHADFIGMTVNQMRHLANIGALHELHYSFVTSAVAKPQSLATIGELIKEVGVEHCYIATDGGQAVNPSPLTMYSLFLEGLSKLGFTEDELFYMSHSAPARLLGMGSNSWSGQ